MLSYMSCDDQVPIHKKQWEIHDYASYFSLMVISLSKDIHLIFMLYFKKWSHITGPIKLYLVKYHIFSEWQLYSCEMSEQPDNILSSIRKSPSSIHVHSQQKEFYNCVLDKMTQQTTALRNAWKPTKQCSAYIKWYLMYYERCFLSNIYHYARLIYIHLAYILQDVRRCFVHFDAYCIPPLK